MGHALLGWIVVVIPASVVLTLLLLPVFTLLKRRYAQLPHLEPRFTRHLGFKLS